MTTHNALAAPGAVTIPPPDSGFDFTSFRIFTSVPDHRDFGIAALRGMVVIYDETQPRQEGIVEGCFYVREHQRPRSGLTWGSWLELEGQEAARRVGPARPLEIRREVVQAIRWPKPDQWAVRLAGGYVDGPYYDWAFGLDLIGKVVGIYLPNAKDS